MNNTTVSELSERTAVLRAEMEGLNTLAQSFGQRLVVGLADAVIHGRKLSDVMRGVALSMANQALSQALRPLGSIVGGALSGKLTPFANGGVVNGPMLFPHAGGAGLMGEAGPEAILPLARGPDGHLGVRAGGSRSVTVNISIQTPDLASFRQSQTQIAAQLARAVSRGERNL